MYSYLHKYIKPDVLKYPSDSKRKLRTLGFAVGNDVIIGSRKYKDHNYVIYVKLYHINDEPDWEELQNNAKVPDGGYFYIIRVGLPTGKRTFKGSLTIIR